MRSLFNRLILTAGLLAALPALAMPALTTKTESGITFAAPADWKTLVTAADHGVTISRDAFTSFDVHWYDYKSNRTLDQLLDLVVKVTAENVPMGTVTETSRSNIAGGRLATANFTTMGYTLKMGFAVGFDPSGTKVKAVIFRTSPESWTDLSAPQLIEAVMAGFKVP